MLNLNLPRIDLDAEINGTWFHFKDGIKFKIARHNNKNYIKKILSSKEENSLSPDTKMSDCEAKKIMAKVYAESILIDWEGVSDESGSLTYTSEIGSEMLYDEQYRDVLDFIDEKSKESNNFYQKGVEEQGKE